MSDINKLLEIMAGLRDPENGCPWDLEQDFKSIAPYTLEEAYEVADAIDRGDLENLREELGDLLLQVVFHARMAEEVGAFKFSDVVESIAAKMVRRHPHVFGGERLDTAEEQRVSWEAHKKAERDIAGQGSSGILAGVGLALPALIRAGKLGKRASSVGFDWPDAEGVRAKIDEELAEVDEAKDSDSKSELNEEIGDLLFAIANFARHHDIDPEESLRAANRKFTNRFSEVEKRVGDQGCGWDAMSAEDIESIWDAVKASE
jgi:ATP diphosphatase